MSIPATLRALDAYQRCCWTQSRSSSSSRARRISSAVIWMPSLIIFLFPLDQLEPEEAARGERQQVRQLADPGELRTAEQLHGIAAFEAAQIELDRLSGAGDIVNAQDQIILERTQVREDAGVRGLDRLVGPEAEHGVLLAERDEAMQPAELRGRGAELGLDVDGLEPVHRVHQRWCVQLREIRSAEAAVAVSRPLHGRPHPVAVAEEYVVAHRDLVAVVEDGRAGQREHDRVHELDVVAPVVEQRGEAPPDAD